MANRTRDYYRKMRKKAINRKLKIINSYRQDNPPAFYNENETDNELRNSYGDISSYWYVKHKGVLSKGKIHCSCGLCSFHGTTMQDRRKLASMESKLKNKLKKEINGVYHPSNSCFPGTTVDHHSLFDYNAFEKETKRTSLVDELYRFMYSLELYKRSHNSYKGSTYYYKIPADSYRYMCHTVSKFLIVEGLFIESLSELSSVLNDYITEDRRLKYLAFESKVYINIESIYQVASILKKYL